MLLAIIFPLLLLFLQLVDTNTIMALVFGVPNYYGNLDFTLNWHQCVQSCYNSTACVMAWQVQGACMTYNYDSMPIVSQTDSTNGSIVAFKVDATNGKCGVNPLDNQNATGSLYITSGLYPKWVNYTISPVGNTWKMSYSVNSSCTGTLYYHQRSDGTGLCYSVEIEQYCSAHYRFTGFNDMYPSYRALLLNRTGSESTYVRVDGKRTTECQATPKTSDCMSVNGFTFVGPAPRSFDYFDWVTDSSAQETPDDNCIVIVWNGNNPIKMDVRACSEGENPLPTRMTMCLGQAWGL